MRCQIFCPSTFRGVLDVCSLLRDCAWPTKAIAKEVSQVTHYRALLFHIKRPPQFLAVEHKEKSKKETDGHTSRQLVHNREQTKYYASRPILQESDHIHGMGPPDAWTAAGPNADGWIVAALVPTSVPLLQAVLDFLLLLNGDDSASLELVAFRAFVSMGDANNECSPNEDREKDLDIAGNHQFGDLSHFSVCVEGEEGFFNIRLLSYV